MDTFRRKITKDFISFREKPGTELEESVAKFLTAFLNDYNNRRIEKLADYFTDDAIIDAKAIRTTVTKPTYIKIMSQAINDLFLFTLDQAAVVAENSDKSTVKVYGVLSASRNNRRQEGEFCTIYLKRCGGEWKITRTVLESISGLKSL